MSSTLVECVPNFSEGRDREKVDAIVAAMRVEEVFVLDCEMDADHNRSVITLIGTPEAIAEAAIRGVGRAAELIDLTSHAGAHPRIGAADVVPFIPIEGVTLQDCVAIARHVGEQIWKRFGIPVYLYEAAANVPERQNLENIRRGQFEGLRQEVTGNPSRRPDFGTNALHPRAGATVVGARKPLIAYNIYLNTSDVEIARKIGKAVRFSSGGLRFVKGMGVRARGMAQVSMNLTDFEQTSIARVYEFVKREATRYGVMPVSSEIVGLIPQKALEEAAEWFLQIENFDSSLILENRLATVMGRKTVAGGIRAGVEPFIEKLASSKAVPGGGSAAAAAAAMGAALAQMVADLSRDENAWRKYELQLSSLASQLGKLREDLTSAVDADANACVGVMKAFRADKGSEGETAKVDALKRAVEVSLNIALGADMVSRLVDDLGPITGNNLSSDLVVAAGLAKAAREGALAKVEINLENLNPEGLEAQDFIRRVRDRISGFTSRV